MKRKQSTEEQIITILKEAEAGAKVGDLIRRHGIAEGTYYRWKAKYGGMAVSEQQERQMLKRRIRAGMDKAKALGTRSGAPIGRPRITAEQQSGIPSLRREGRSYQGDLRKLELSKSVVYRYLKASA